MPSLCGVLHIVYYLELFIVIVLLISNHVLANGSAKRIIDKDQGGEEATRQSQIKEDAACPVTITDVQRATLHKLMDDALQTTLKTLKDEHELDTNEDALGSGHVVCFNRNEEILYQKEFGIGFKQAVSMRSLSKVMVAAAVMALHERGDINIDEPIGGRVCEGTPVANATLIQLISMSAKGMDWRINAARIAQLKRRNQPVDFVGFPPLCDELGYGPLKCAQEYICPFLRGEEKVFALAGIDKAEIDDAMDVSCSPFDKEERRSCLRKLANKGLERATAYMSEHCRFTFPMSGCQPTVQIGDHKFDPATVRWEYRYDAKLDRIIKKANPFVYDNYGYTVADAYVQLKTGMSVVEAVERYVFEPLGMKGSLKCLQNARQRTPNQDDNGRDDFQCLAPPSDVHEWFVGKFQPWTKGQMSPSWVSNTFFASAADMIKFMSALLRNGTLSDGQTQFLRKESVDKIFTPRIYAPRPMATCIGTQAFGLGIGYCEAKESLTTFRNKYSSSKSMFHPQQPGISMCSSERSWSWGASHGSRISLIRDKGGIGCAAILNTPNMGTYNTRAHFIGHNMSAILRDSFGVD